MSTAVSGTQIDTLVATQIADDIADDIADNEHSGGGLCARDICPFGKPCPDLGLDRLMALSPVSTVVVCLVDRKIVWASPRALGFDALLVERDVVDPVVEPDQLAIETLLTEAVAGHDGIRASVKARSADGTLRPSEVVSALPGHGSRQCVLYVTPSERDTLPAVVERTRVLATVTSLSGTVLWTAPEPLRALNVTFSEVAGRKIWEVEWAKAPVVHRLFGRVTENPAHIAHERTSVSLAMNELLLDLYVERLADGPFDRLLWWSVPVHSEAGASQDQARTASLVAAMEAIARQVDQSGFGVPSHVSAVKHLDGIDRLSERERTVVELLARGQRPQAIADHLFVSASTVRNNLSSIYQKLGFPDQAALLQFLLGGPRELTPSGRQDSYVDSASHDTEIDS